MDLCRLEALLANAADNGVEQMCGLTCPTGERGAVDIETLRRHHLGLPVERQMMIELVHDHMGERGKAGLAPGNGLGRGWRLHDDACTGCHGGTDKD